MSNAVERVLQDTAVDLRVPERVLRTVVEDMPDRLLLLDLNLIIRFANRGIFDTPREQLPGHSILDFVPDQEHERVRSIYEAAAADRAPKVYELRQQVRHETRWFENRIGPVMHEGRMFAFAVACSEITARRRNEEALRVLEREITEISSREQRRIGNDLHDGLGQELTGIALMLRSLTARLQKEGHPLADEAEGIVGLVNNAIESARSLAHGLAPVSLERGGLPYALRTLSALSEDMYKVRVRFHSKIWPQLTLPAATCNHLYRVTQEAISNAVKHGRARDIVIDLQAKGDAVTLVISDDGRGFAPGVGLSSGMGLKIMQYRANIIGGTVAFEPRAGGGTRLVCSCRQPVVPITIDPHAPQLARRRSGRGAKSLQNP